VWTGEPAAPPPASAGATALDIQAHAPLAYTPPHLAEKILTSRSALEGERKQVTVLFADLKGSMELLADRDPEEARQLLDPVLERALGLCREADFTLYSPWMAAALGVAYTLAGCIADAVPLLTQAMAQSIATETVVFQTYCSRSLGEAQMLAGCLEEAHTLTERALALARVHQERGHEAYALRLLGDIAVRRNPPDSEPAAAHYRQALALAEELGMRPLQAHCHLGLGSLYVQTGHPEPARAALTAAIGLYRAMGMTFWLPQAEATLRQVSSC
jgi:tetratricopeptide (TPR) repeat protein